MPKSIIATANLFTPFQRSVESYALPKKFTFPFYYEPHPLCILAAKELQRHLQYQTDWEHNFGLDSTKKSMVIGKMFGVLVVQNTEGQLGYLAAFSGKLANKNHHPRFVPPVFDMLTKDGFFKQEEVVLNDLNRQIEVLENATEFIAAKDFHKKEKALATLRIAAQKAAMKTAKKARKTRRATAKSELSDSDYQKLLDQLKNESIKSHFYLKDLNRYWQERLAKSEAQLAVFTDKIAALKLERKTKSAALQKKLFDQYQFLNSLGERKSLLSIFELTLQKTPPAGAGECAAPKLLQHAFLHQLKPIAMAEFWWGQSPKSEIRRHQQFYPACRGKCEPILAHMLSGMELDENPMLKNPAAGKKLDILYEDAHIIIVNKPAEFLSVPGKNIQDSVYQRICQKYPKVIGPLVVHRLDMSTSGLMLIARDKDTHKYLQYQFIKRLVQKRYVALLDGIVKEKEGFVDLPLRVDLDNRPQQLVCYEHGKTARTKYRVIAEENGKTRIHFFPITGRTHQLRVHAAHPLGLNTPIVGDDLYGKKSNRLYLHAESITFQHPSSKEKMNFTVKASF